jgi:hemoglobin-like flavoprotein
MTPQQIAHIRQSFALVAPVAPQAAAMFYENLFTADPALRPMFRGDMVQQGNLLMRMIQGAVGMLDNPELLLPTLHALGARHVAYGVKEQHYGTVGRALLRTLSEALGDAFTPDVADAWATMYDLVSRTMREGADVAAAADARSATLVV